MNTDEINKTIGTRIASLRQLRGLTAADMAKQLTISQWRLTRIENCRSEATAAELVMIAGALRVTTAVLSGEELFSEFVRRVEAAQAEAGAR